MRILVFSDIHQDYAALEKLVQTPADWYVSAGDLANFGKGLDRCADILAPIGEKLWVMPGNHETVDENTAFCGRYGFRDLHGKSFEAAGHHIAGLGYSSPTPFQTPGEYSEAEIEKRLAPFAELKPLVLICHAPPKDTDLDAVNTEIHAGSTAVRAFVDAHQPVHMFCGHIHEGAGLGVELGATKARNVGKKGYLLTL